MNEVPKNDFWMIGVIVIFSLAIFAGGAAFVWGPSYLRDRETNRLQEVGILAKAEVVSFKDTGNRFNDVPEIITTVDVKGEGKEVYRVDIRSIGYGQPKGTTLWVRVDPVDPQNVVYQRTEPEQ